MQPLSWNRKTGRRRHPPPLRNWTATGTQRSRPGRPLSGDTPGPIRWTGPGITRKRTAFSPGWEIIRILRNVRAGTITDLASRSVRKRTGTQRFRRFSGREHTATRKHRSLKPAISRRYIKENSRTGTRRSGSSQSWLITATRQPYRSTRPSISTQTRWRRTGTRKAHTTCSSAWTDTGTHLNERTNPTMNWGSQNATRRNGTRRSLLFSKPENIRTQRNRSRKPTTGKRMSWRRTVTRKEPGAFS